MSKKGQITIFAVMGLILIIIVGLFIYATQSANPGPEPDDELTFTYEQSLVKNNVESCISRVTEEGVRKLGANGGYINPGDFGFVALKDFPTSGSALMFSPNSDYIIPYWDYMKSSNSCEDCYFDSGKPPLNKKDGQSSIESQLSDYVVANLDNCLDLDQFEQFKVETYGPIFADVVLGSDIVVQVTYPMQIQLFDGSAKDIDFFETSLDLDVGRLFGVAEDVLALTQLDPYAQTTFFTEATMELITVHALDGTMPPLAGTVSFDFKAPDMWVKSDVSDEIKEALSEITSLVQIIGSSESIYMVDENAFFREFYQNYQVMLPTDFDTIQDMRIEFIYLPWWEPYLSVSPGYGEVIMDTPSTTFSNFGFGIAPFDSFMYTPNSFSYDISYPLVVSLEDKSAFNGEGFTLVYAFEVNVRNDKAVALAMQQADEQFEGISFQRSLFADRDNWNSGTITIKATNPKDGSGVEGLGLQYSCGDESAYIGTPILNAYGEAVLETKLPVCLGGIISSFHKDYFIPSIRIDTYTDEPQNITIYAEQKQKFEVTFKERMVGKTIGEDDEVVWAFRPSSERDIAFDENLIAVFTREKNLGDMDFISQIMFYGNQSDKPTVDLVSGKYNVDVFLFQGPLTIPEQEIEDDVTVPEIKFNDTFYGGGISMTNATSGFFEVTYDDLNKNDLLFYILAYEHSDFTESADLSQLGLLDTYVTNNSISFVPEFS